MRCPLCNGESKETSVICSKHIGFLYRGGVLIATQDFIQTPSRGYTIWKFLKTGLSEVKQ